MIVLFGAGCGLTSSTDCQENILLLQNRVAGPFFKYSAGLGWMSLLMALGSYEQTELKSRGKCSVTGCALASWFSRGSVIQTRTCSPCQLEHFTSQLTSRLLSAAVCTFHQVLTLRLQQNKRLTTRTPHSANTRMPPTSSCVNSRRLDNTLTTFNQ